MLYKIYYHHIDGSLVEDVEFGVVDFDYWNIRQWRKLFTKLNLRNVDKDDKVTLEIVPQKDDVIF